MNVGAHFCYQKRVQDGRQTALAISRTICGFANTEIRSAVISVSDEIVVSMHMDPLIPAVPLIQASRSSELLHYFMNLYSERVKSTLFYSVTV